MHYQLVGFFGRIKYLENIAEILRRLDLNIAELYSVRTRNTPPPPSPHDNEAYGPRSKFAPNI